MNVVLTAKGLSVKKIYQHLKIKEKQFKQKKPELIFIAKKGFY